MRKLCSGVVKTFIASIGSIALSQASAWSQDGVADPAAETYAKAQACESIQPANEISTSCSQVCSMAWMLLGRAPNAPMTKIRTGECGELFDQSGAKMPELNAEDPDTLRSEALNKMKICSESPERDRATQRCVRSCNSAANLLGGSRGENALSAQNLITDCRDYFTAAGFTDNP